MKTSMLDFYQCKLFWKKINNLELALDELTSNTLISIPITNPIGCSVKWEGKDSHWMPPEACDLV